MHAFVATIHLNARAHTASGDLDRCFPLRNGTRHADVHRNVEAQCAHELLGLGLALGGYRDDDPGPTLRADQTDTNAYKPRGLARGSEHGLFCLFQVHCTRRIGTGRNVVERRGR